MTTNWPRAMPALVTAFDSSGEVDLVAHGHNVATAVASGTQGILIAGSTGEGPYLEPGERSALVDSARRTSHSLTILCGVFAESGRQAAAQIREAADGGADAVLVVTPTTLVRGRRSTIVDYYEWVADQSPLPVILYSVPRVTGYELPCASVVELAHHRNIIGMKDSGGDVERLTDVEGILSELFIVYAGSSRVLAESAKRGAYGAITASANYAFTTVAEACSGDASAQQRLAAVISVVEEYGVSGTKFAASLAGMHPGNGRRPLPRLDADVQQAIVSALEHLNADI